MAFELSIKLNNQVVNDHLSYIIISDEFPTINWSFDLANRVEVNSDTGVISDLGEFSQVSYEIRISTSSINIGEDYFIGNRVQTGVVNSQSSFWKYSGISLIRGSVYYGQIRVVDELDRQSDWSTFSFLYNSLPYVSNVELTPVSPSVTDDIELSYDFYDDNGETEYGTKIRWFKNGIYQKQFDDTTIISSVFLQNGDIWNADIYPSDGIEYGERVTSYQVKVSKTAVVVSDLHILPKNPNPDDVLKADYVIDNYAEQDNVKIRWYINDLLFSFFNDEQYVKLPISEGDEVRFEIKHSDSNIYQSSASVEVVGSDFMVSNIVIDGRIEPLNVSSITPLIQWDSFIPDNKSANYLSIKIGTFYEADNVYSSIISYSKDSFAVPNNLLKRGKDYYVSISLSETQVFDKYVSSHFRVYGSDWEESVSNSSGWTLETLLFVPVTAIINGQEVDQSENLLDYHVIRINDGDKFAELRIYSNKIQLISGDNIEYSVDTTKTGVITIAGKNDDIMIYFNRELVINGEGIFTQISNIKRLEIGAASVGDFEVDYKYFFYTTAGYFLPGISSQYSDIKFHTFMEFEGNEIVSLQGYVGGKHIFGLNPDNTNDSSSIYAIKPGAKKRGKTVPRTFSPINKISKSFNNNFVAFAHARGATLMTGYLIDNFDNELIFVDSNNNLYTTPPNSMGWELVRNTSFNASYFNDDGFNINTLGI